MNDLKFLKVPYAQSVHGQAEIDAVVEVLKTSTQMGKNVTEMEQRVAKMFHKKYGLMTNSGTSSLMLAAEAADLPKGSEVITAAFTFATTVTPILKNDLVPVFMDAEKDTLKSDKALLRRLHVKVGDKVFSGAKAFLLVWKKIPKYRFLYYFFKLPIIYSLFLFGYEIIAYFLYIKNKKQLNTVPK